MSTVITVGAYVYREDGPRGDDEGLVVATRGEHAIIQSWIHSDRAVYKMADLVVE